MIRFPILCRTAIIIGGSHLNSTIFIFFREYRSRLVPTQLLGHEIGFMIFLGRDDSQCGKARNQQQNIWDQHASPCKCFQSQKFIFRDTGIRGIYNFSNSSTLLSLLIYLYVVPQNLQLFFLCLFSFSFNFQVFCQDVLITPLSHCLIVIVVFSLVKLSLCLLLSFLSACFMGPRERF